MGLVLDAIDVDGRVVPESVEALSSTAPPDARAYTESVLATKFVASRYPEREPLCVMRVDAMRWGSQTMVLPQRGTVRPPDHTVRPMR